MPRHRSLPRWLVRCTVAAVLLGVLVVGSWLGYRYHGPTPPLEIYRGITYGCDVQPDTADGNGLVHWVRADLAVPGVRLYVTPIDADAKAAGWEYKLRRVSTVVADERLAAAVNGTRFESDSTLVRLAGDNARSSETAVANGVANHVDPNTYLMWWDRDGVAHAQPTKPPPPSVLSSAVWGIGMQQYLLVDGAVSFWAGHDRLDRCTAIGADPARHLVWIVCLDRASYFDAARELLRLGATIGGPVDGGTSTAMALGDEARDVRPGTVTGNWRPVATTFGFRADPLPE